MSQPLQQTYQTRVKAILDGQKSKLKAICENTGLEEVGGPFHRKQEK